MRLLNWFRQRPFYPLIPRCRLYHIINYDGNMIHVRRWKWLGHCFSFRHCQLGKKICLEELTKIKD